MRKRTFTQGSGSPPRVWLQRSFTVAPLDLSRPTTHEGPRGAPTHLDDIALSRTDIDRPEQLTGLLGFPEEVHTLEAQLSMPTDVLMDELMDWLLSSASYHDNADSLCSQVYFWLSRIQGNTEANSEETRP